MISDPDVIGLLYLVAIVCFILALRFLSSPKHARRGNWVGGLGMLVAIGTTLALEGIGNWGLLAVAAAIGTAAGLIGARTVKMTAMPQMVALFNGVGGGAAALIAFSEFHVAQGDVASDEIVSIVLSSLIGSVSFAGSMVAFAKLQEILAADAVVAPPLADETRVHPGGDGARLELEGLRGGSGIGGEGQEEDGDQGRGSVGKPGKYT